MVDNKRKTVVKTIRIPSDLNIFLNDEAKASNVTPSTLISTIFTLHKERYRHFEKLKPVALYPAILASFVDLISEEDHLSDLEPPEDPLDLQSFEWDHRRTSSITSKLKD